MNWVSYPWIWSKKLYVSAFFIILIIFHWQKYSIYRCFIASLVGYLNWETWTLAGSTVSLQSFVAFLRPYKLYASQFDKCLNSIPSKKIKIKKNKNNINQKYGSHIPLRFTDIRIYITHKINSKCLRFIKHKKMKFWNKYKHHRFFMVISSEAENIQSVKTFNLALSILNRTCILQLRKSRRFSIQ